MAQPSNPYPLEARVDPALVRSVRQASRASGSEFGLLMAEAQQESGFRATAKAVQGSAQGLYQFVDQTWLEMVHRFGAKYGLSEQAQEISVDSSGHATAADPATRARILALRNDPGLSAALAGEYANLNKGEVERALGRSAGPADLYMAHFLGAAGATTFLKALATNGNTAAAAILPDAAQSNRSIFYDAAGQPKTVAQIYQALGGRIAEEAQKFGALADDGGVAAGAAGATSDATRVASLGNRTDFAGLKLTDPVAAMLDTLTLAALQMTGAKDQVSERKSAPDT
jgi:hypothetical protein